MNTAIATKLNILESAIVRVEEWANVLFVVIRGLGGRFVSKKVIEVKKVESRQTISPEAAAKIVSNSVGGNVKTLPNGDAKLWIGKGYLLFAVETETTAQVCWHLKRYDNTPEIRQAVTSFNEHFIVSSLAESETDSFRDGMVARHGLYEVLDAEADVARENWDI